MKQRSTHKQCPNGGSTLLMAFEQSPAGLMHINPHKVFLHNTYAQEMPWDEQNEEAGALTGQVLVLTCK